MVDLAIKIILLWTVFGTAAAIVADVDNYKASPERRIYMILIAGPMIWLIAAVKAVLAWGAKSRGD